MAFNAKNLQYNKQEPAFLRRLKDDYIGQDGRQTYQAPRPKRDRLKSGDDDDDPVVVDEQGEMIDKHEFERRMKGEDLPTADFKRTEETAAGGSGVEEAEEATTERTMRQNVTEIGGSAGVKKRKAGKVVGGEDDQEDGTAAHSKTTKGTEESAKGSKGVGPNPIKKKKGKKIKLSFDDPDG